jgi:hypothetical protein
MMGWRREEGGGRTELNGGERERGCRQRTH